MVRKKPQESKKASGGHPPQRCGCKHKSEIYFLVYQGTFVREPLESSICITLKGKILQLATAAVRGPAGRGTRVLGCCLSPSGLDLESLCAYVNLCRNCTQAAPSIPAPVQEMQLSGEGLRGRNNRSGVKEIISPPYTCHNPSLATLS